MYAIYLGKNKKAKVDVNIDHNVPTAIPASILTGVGNKKVRYAKHLDKALSDNTELLKYLAFIHKNGKEHGDINLLCKCTLHKFHAQCVKDFILTHYETLDAIIPYLFAGEGYKGEAIKVNLADLPESLRKEYENDMQPVSSQNQPSPEDLAAIYKLIEEDQARERAGLPLVGVDAISVDGNNIPSND